MSHADETQLIEAQGQEIHVSRDPNAVLAEAKKAAEALMAVVEKKPKPVMYNGARYLEFEDWQTVGKFYGLTVKVRSTTFIQYGDVRGFEAAADVVRQDGSVISSAEAMCLNDEENWSTRPKYEWQDDLDADGKKQYYTKDGRQNLKKKKVKVADIAVPLFQLRSMAQTRACAKALRNVLAWVVVMAGYEPTPAEEVTGTEREASDQTLPEKPKEKVSQQTVEASTSESEADQSGKAKVPGGFVMVARHDGLCAHCTKETKTGSEIVWDKANKKAYHKDCVA